MQRRLLIIFVGVCVLFLSSSAFAADAKNVVLMVSDGLGMNGWEAAKISGSNMTYDGYTGTDVYFYGMTHYMLNSDGTPQGYDEEAMWSDFNYTKGNNDYTAFTDSAAAATAMYSGEKTYGGAIGVDFYKEPVTSYFEKAAAAGMATGAISSVQMSHATPGAVDAHNTSRGNYADIANEMIYDSDLDVIMGAGPGGSDEKYVGGKDTLADIQDGDGANGFTYIHKPGDFQDLAEGTMPLPDKVIGLADTPYTLGNEYWPGENDETKVPTLETMTKGSLNVLAQNPEGFALLVEGGAVDWMNHGKNYPDMLTEQKDFDNAVTAVIEWVEAESSWEETLLIVTADHETGMIWGEGTWTDKNANDVYDDGIDAFHGFQRVQDANGDEIADVLYGSSGHTNQMVPLWAMGAGAHLFAKQVDGIDEQAAKFWEGAFDQSWNGAYVDNTDIYRVMSQASAVPEPGVMWLLGMGLLGLAGCGRRFKK